MRKYLLLGFLFCSSILGEDQGNVTPDYLLRHPTLENLTTLFMQALNADNATQKRVFIQTLTDSNKPSQEQITQKFIEALERLLEDYRTAQPAKEVIHYVNDEIEGTERENLVRHIAIAQQAIKGEKFTSDDLIFALAAIGYLTGLLEGPQTKPFVTVSHKELAAVEKKILTLIEESSEIMDGWKKTSNIEEVDMEDPARDTMSVQDKTVITRDGDRIYTKKITRELKRH